MKAQIEVLSYAEAVALGKLLDDKGYHWHIKSGYDVNDFKFFDYNEWNKYLPHKFYFIGFFRDKDEFCILHGKSRYDAGGPYDFNGTAEEFFDLMGASFDDFDIEDEKELVRLLFA